MTIEKIDHTDPAVEERLRAFLAPHEPHALFILGNLRSSRPADVYVADSNGRWLGVCAYYGTFKSLIPFSTDAQVVRDMVRHVVGIHPQVSYLNGIDYVAAPAYELMLSLGYQADNDPHQVFMELEGLPPPQDGEILCRAFCGEDAEQTARVLRSLRDGSPGRYDAPVTQNEIDKVMANTGRWVLVKDGIVVSTAATSGIGIHACQIIGVATHPGHRRRGYASAVCAYLIREMAQRGAQRSLLFTGHDNVIAQQCYERLGFRITGKYYVAQFRDRG